jgi:drug/metabolite transporter (DMT)-like permease
LLALWGVRGGERLERKTVLRLCAAGAMLALHFGAWIASLDDTSVAVSTLLVATVPLWNAAYDGLVLRRRFPWTVPAALLTAIAGLALIVSAGHAPAPRPGMQLAGAALALIGAIAFAAYLVLVRGVREAAGTRSIVTVTYSVAAVVLLAVAAAARQPFPPLEAHAAWGGILAMALISQLLGHTAMNASLRWFSPTTVAVSTLLEPVIAAIAALAIFGESLTGLAIAGAIILLGSVGVVLWTAPNEELA